MECYICHRLIERHEYTLHIGSHVAGNATGLHPSPWPVPAFPTFSYDTVDYDHHNTVLPAHSTPPRLRARTPQEHAHHLRPAIPNDQLQSSDLGDSLAQSVPADNHREARFTPSRSQVRSKAVPDRAPQQETPGGQSTQLNAFQTWLNNYAHDSPKYTTIDGEKSDSDLQAFREAAKVLRGATKEEVVKIVKEFEGFPCSGDQKTCLELVRKVPIFPGLVAYTYTHLITCPQRGWLGWVYNDDWSDRVSELKQLVECWTKYDDIWCILSCDKIKERLLKVLCATKVRPEEHKCNSALLLNGTMVLNYDILNLAALAALCITGSRKEDILGQRGAQVGKLIELLHDLLESNVELEECYRRHFFNVLITFSKGSGCCPRGIYITEGAISGFVWESRGGFGSVYKGKLGSRSVAVKALKRDNSMSLPDYSKQLSKEAIVWRYLRHPNCLPLYGVYTMPTEGPNISLALVSPWMDQGTLLDYLKHHPEANRTKLILDVVRGLTYLHTMKPHVAHRDIKPDNILITRQGHACLADFGLVATFDTNDRLHTAASQVEMGGTYNYMAPEIFDAMNSEAKRRVNKRRQVNKRACDMYALGCTIYAAYTSGHPFEGMATPRLCTNVMSGRRPEFPVDKIPHDMWSFVENLWDFEPEKRLTAEMALDWMEVKASQEGVDSSLGPLGEEEWEWKSQPDDKSLWSVSF